MKKMNVMIAHKLIKTEQYRKTKKVSVLEVVISIEFIMFRIHLRYS